MDLEDLERGFRGNDVPELLVQLVAFDEGNETWFSGEFELYDDGEKALMDYFDDDDEAAAQFVAFGTDGTNGLYAYWRYGGRALDDAPIVFLAPDVEDSTVLASSLEEFLVLLSGNYESVGTIDDWDAPEEPENEREHARFLDWLDQEIGLDIDQNLEEIVERARGRHPNLSRFVVARMEASEAG